MPNPLPALFFFFKDKRNVVQWLERGWRTGREKNERVGIKSPEGKRTRHRSFGQAGMQAEKVKKNE